uniref:mRNA-decapping enzyme C-terminal domain-containing protein n=1 Tax=Acrobeloides nanus TaxID=290746 RepID=A0A914CRX3_9BILA
MSTTSAQNLTQKNLASIKRIDPFAEKVVAHALHVAVYDFSLTNKTWEKTEYDGPMFIYKRVDKPFCSFMIANRQSLTDFIEPITPNLKLKLELPYIFIHKPDGSITGLWFPKNEECSKIFELLNKIIEANGTVPDSLFVKAPGSVSATPVTSKPINPITATPFSTDNTQLERNEPKPIMTISPQKLSMPKRDVPSHPSSAKPNLSDIVGPATTMNAFVSPPKRIPNTKISNDSLENGMAKAFASTTLNEAKSNQINNAPSIQSSAAVSNAVCVGLNKEQLLQAIEHLLLNDPDFLDKIHQAYSDSLAARLRR